MLYNHQYFYRDTINRQTVNQGWTPLSGHETISYTPLDANPVLLLLILLLLLLLFLFLLSLLLLLLLLFSLLLLLLLLSLLLKDTKFQKKN